MKNYKLNQESDVSANNGISGISSNTGQAICGTKCKIIGVFNGFTESKKPDIELEESSNGKLILKIVKNLIDNFYIYQMVQGILEEEGKQTIYNVEALFVKLYNGKKLLKYEKQIIFKFHVNVRWYLGSEQEMKFYILNLQKLSKII